MDLKTVLVGQIQGTDLSLYEMLRMLQVKGRLRPLLMEALTDKVIANAVAAEKIEVSDEELQKAGDSFRQMVGLNKQADTQRWLAANQLSPRDLELGLEQALARQKLIDKVTGAQAPKFFEDNRNLFDRARLSHLVVDTEDKAQEVLAQIREEGLDFTEAVRRFSMDEASKRRGGRLGLLSRKRLTPAVEDAVFAAQPGEVVGPFATGKRFHLVKVEEVRPGQLDAGTMAFIRRRLFRLWVRDRVRQGNVQVRLFDYLQENG